MTNEPAYHEHLATTTADTRTVNRFDGFDQELNEISSTASENSRSIGTNDSKVTSSTSKPRDLGKCATPEDPPDINFVSAKDACDKNDNYNHRNLNNFQSGGTPQYITSSSAFEAWNKSASKSNLGSALQSACRIGRETSKKNEKNHQISSDQVFESSAINTDVTNQSRKIHPRLSKQYPTPTKVHVVAPTPTIDNSRKSFRQISPPSSSFIQSNSAGAFRAPSQAAGIRGVAKYSESHSQKIMTSSCHNYDSNSGTHANDRQYDHTIYSTSSNFSHCSHTEDGSQFYKTSNNLEGKSSYPSLPTSYKNVGYANTETKPAPGNTSTTSNRFDLSAKTTVLSPQQPASNQSFQFASLSPERAAKWDLAQEIQQQENLRHQMEGKDITYSKVHRIPHVGNANVSGSRGRVVNDRQASVPSSTEMDPGIEGSGRKEREDMSVESENSSEISSLPPEERTEYRYDNIDLLLDDHLAEHEINGFDSTDLVQIPQGQADEKSGGRHENGVTPAMGGTTMQPQHQYPQQQLRANPQFWGDQLVCAPSHATKSAEPVTPAPIIPCVTMSDQSTIESSPAMSSGMLKSPGGKQSKHTVENISHDQHHRNKARNIDGLEPNDLGATLKPKNSNGSQIPKEPTNTKNSNVTIPKSSLFDSETALYATLPTTATYSNREVSELRSKLRNVEMQLQNITTANNSLQNRLVENDIRIEKLVASEEEARQEAALWEARWRDDFACNVEVSDHKPVLAKLRGALLQKSREESESLRTKIKSLQSQIKEMEESYSVQLTTLVSENKELHKKLEQSEKFIGGSFTKQSTSRSSSITESNPLAQIDRIAKESRESEQRWSSKFATAQKELDQMRREISTLQNKKKELLEKMKSTEKSACDWEKRAIDSKKQLSDCRDELNRATNAKNALLEELNHHRESSELLRKECQSIHEKLEQKLKEETEEQKADSEKTNQILSDDDCARSKTIQELESTVARLSQENDTLVEENASVSKENERLARRFVELERALNTASIEADECRASLQSAENRISSLSEEKEELRETIRRIETEHNATTAELQGISQELANSRSGEERAQEQLIELQQEVEEARREIESLSEQNRMLNSQLSSLNEYHTNAQEELESWQQAKEDLEAEVNTLSAENDRLNIENAAINERLDNSQQLITTLQRSQFEQTSQSGPIVEENRILRSSLAGLEHQIERIESDLSTERQALAATKHARDQAERKIGEMETQIKNLQHDLSSARSAISSERDENLRLQRDMDEMKKLITSLREENSAAAISRSHLELELKQREDECVSLRRQLDPLQKEKYRLELDNSDLSDQIGKLKMITRDRTDEQEFVPKKNDSSNELVRSLEVKNDELAQYIASLQHDLAKLQNSRLTTDNLQSASPYIPKGSEAPCETQDDKESNETIETKTTTKESNVLHHSCSSHQLVTSKIPRSMIEQLSRARAAVKETSLLLKAQRGNIEVGEASVMLSSFNRVQSPPRSNDNKITATPSHEQQTDDRSSGGEYQTPRQSEFASSDFSTASTPIYSIDPSHNESTVQKDRDDDFSYRKRSISPRRESIRLDESSKQVDNAFLRMQMEEKHSAEKDILKTKYRERIRCMRKEWEGERKAILKLISTEPGFEVSNGDRVYQIVKTPVRRLPDKNDNEVADLKTVTLTSQSQTPKVEPTNSSDDSFLETEAFVMSVLNEFEKQSV